MLCTVASNSTNLNAQLPKIYTISPDPPKKLYRTQQAISTQIKPPIDFFSVCKRGSMVFNAEALLLTVIDHFGHLAFSVYFVYSS